MILDEFGMLGFDSKAARHLFRLVSERYQKSSTIIAANAGFKKWKTFFPSEAECVATVDRLVDKATILPLRRQAVARPRGHPRRPAPRRELTGGRSRRTRRAERRAARPPL